MKPSLLLFSFFTLSLLFTSGLQAQEGMVLIPAAGGQPAFYLDKTEVTQGPYQTFQEQTIYRRTPEFAAKKVHGPDYPVRLSTWFHAAHFCSWAGKRLPTVEEWNRAAGKGKRVYPWGDEKLDSTRANFCDINCVTPWHDILQDDTFERYSKAGSFPAGATPEGILDMAGNLWEWTSTIAKTGKSLDWKGENYENAELDYFMVIKGGSYGSKPTQLKNEDSAESPINFRSSHVGFRCAKDVEVKGK
ncbi:MAG: SUMF1/EgtB/PvdO family nonheme iron enzyme [SAR324 cluster bacterium]|nr:SUMF1/EgtB/PvdO family nonheme iron enzyme [SAR324 cluster bacterium]